MEWAWLVLTVVCSGLASGHVMMEADNECDWDVWDNTEKQGVRTVRASCTAGHIGWHHPYGGVNIVLGLPDSPAFVLCFSATALATTATISLDTVNGTTGTVMMERLATLHGAHGDGEAAAVREVCIESSRGHSVKLYLEAEMHHHSTIIGHVHIDYDMEAVGKKVPGQVEDYMEECRPCTDEELLLAVCSSDFVVQGEIASVNHQPDFDETEIHLQVSKMHRQSHSIFHPIDSVISPKESPKESDFSENSLHSLLGGQHRLRTAHILRRRRSTRNSEDAVIESGGHRGGEVAPSSSSSSSSSSHAAGFVVVPHKCRVRAGRGSFLFMGRVRLKRAILKCAPRVEDFEKVYRRAVANNKHKCTFPV